MEPQVIYEEESFAVINKPAGLLVHHMHFWQKDVRRHSSEFEQSLADWITNKYPDNKKVGDLSESRAGIVHRLDKNTSGAIIVAKTNEAFAYFKKLFRNGDIRKIYLALVWGNIMPMSGVIDVPIGIGGDSLRRSAAHSGLKKSAPALTEYKTLRRYNGGIYSLLEVIPKTGRTHQIRVHLSSIGYPIVGDDLYGGGRVKIMDRQFLHAASLEFDAPSGKHLKIDAPLPDDLKKILDELY